MGGGQSVPSSRVVSTSTGPIRGRRLVHTGEKQVEAFQGIPYAKPPIGDLRFKKPEPHDKWEEVRECTAFGMKSIQKPGLLERFHPRISEDCLVLNVFSPAWEPPSGSSFPILLFIHGGGFVSDSTVKYGDEGICSHLVTKGIVVVTIQYRVAFLGFWTSGDSSCTTNLGLWDQRAALLWVKENAAAFYGDPNNITLMGQSAGGASVDLLSLSPTTRDLFHKVIPLAGNASAQWAIHSDPLSTCKEWSRRHLAVDPDVPPHDWMDKLRTVAASKYATSLTFKNSSDSSGGDLLQIGPCLDDEFLPRPISELRKEAPSKPRIVGCCREEGLAMVILDKNLDESRFKGLAKDIIRDEVEDCEKKREEMLAEFPREEGKEMRMRALAELCSDAFLNIAVQKNVIDCLEANDSQVFMYSFDYFNDKMWGPLGWMFPFKAATHCTEMSFLFAVGILWGFTLSEKDLVVLNRFTQAVVNFARCGDPNGVEGEAGHRPFRVEWKAATKEAEQRHLAIDWEASMGDSFRGGRPLKWINAIARR